MADYDMMGLEMYDDGMGAWITGEQLREHLMAAGSGALGILVTSKLVQMALKTPDAAAGMAADARASQEKAWFYYRGIASTALGVLGGRLLYDYNRDAGMGFVGAVAGGAVAQMVAKLAGAPAEGASAGVPYLSTNLAATEWSPRAYSLSSYDLAALESTVATNAPSWAAGEGMAALAAPVVREQQLASTGTTTEEIASYMDAPPPSF